MKNLPVIQETMETWVRSLGWEDPLEEENGNPLQYFLPEQSHGQRSLVGYSPKGCKELDMTKQTQRQKEVKSSRGLMLELAVEDFINY